jgi:hypothetical protein
VVVDVHGRVLPVGDLEAISLRIWDRDFDHEVELPNAHTYRHADEEKTWCRFSKRDRDNCLPPGSSTRKAEFVSSDEFEQRVQAKYGGVRGRLPMSKQRPGGGHDVEIDLITSDALIQIKRVTAPDATFGGKMREQFELTMDAAQLSGHTRVKYIIASEAPETFVTQILELPRPEGIELIIERLSARK